ncbi:MAG: UDP-3-O-(3-hydroxymyristoyl)glucosamine N-acyltransferase [bacterium]
MLASKLADRLGGRLEGEDSELTGVAPLDEAGPGELSFLHAAKYADRLAGTGASAVLVSEEYEGPAPAALIRVDSPYAALRRTLGWLYPETDPPTPGVHPSAVVDPSVRLGEEVSVGPLAVVEADAEVGARTVIGAGSYLGRRVKVGSDCRIHPNVCVCRRCRIGDRVEILSGAVIGSDGFGHSREEGVYRKMPHIGIVVLEDDVLVGACTTIDRATFGETRIEKGAKLDNLVMVAHNCVIGPDTAVVAQAGMAGSTIVGGGVQIGGQAGFAGHLEVGDGAVVGAQAGVTKDIPEGTFVSGYPARPHREAQLQLAAVARLPELRRKVREMESRIADLEARLGEEE